MAIHQFERYVTVTDDLVGFSPTGRVKVWLNPNFGVNHPVQEAADLLRQEEPVLARNMIAQIFAIVEEHTINHQLPSQLRSAFVEERPSNFVQAINLVRDYCTDTGARVASYVSVPTRGAGSTLTTKVI